MTETETAVRIDLGQLVDAYVDRYCDSCADWSEATTWPDIWSVDVDGERWLTDRYTLLPGAVCVLPAGMKPEPIQGTSTQRQVEVWVKALRTNDLGPAVSSFSATFAGVLTLAGLTAYTCGIDGNGKSQPPHVLAVNDKQRIGLIMPVREGGKRYSAIPARQSMLDVYQRLAETDIFGAGVLRSSDAWEIAAALTAGAS